MMKGKAFKFSIINSLFGYFHIKNLISFHGILVLAPNENCTRDYENGGTNQKHVPKASEGVMVTFTSVVVNRVYIETSDNAQNKEKQDK